jgi:hypothetical protein
MCGPFGRCGPLGSGRPLACAVRERSRRPHQTRLTGAADDLRAGLLRVGTLGGALTVSSRPGHGTHVRAPIPLSTGTATTEATVLDAPRH